MTYLITFQTYADEPIDFDRRAVVLSSIQRVCELRRWELVAAFVRAREVSIVVATTGATSDRVLRLFKFHATRALRAAGLEDRPCWTRMGRVQALGNQQDVEGAVMDIARGRDVPAGMYASLAD